MSAREAVALDVGTLAWEADRLSVAELDPERARLLGGVVDYLHRAIPLGEDDELDLGISPEEHDEVKARLIFAEAVLAAIGEALKLAPLDLADLDAEELEGLKAILEARLAHEREEGHKDALVPSRQDAASKGKRLLLEGRIDVTRHDASGPHAGLIVATCRGDSGAVYQLGFDPHRKQWRCTCPELRGHCSHLAALKLITTTKEA